jgi:hypothetical protein
MSPLTRLGTTAAAAVAVLLPCAVSADTVYLKNGAWIDGRVRARNDKILEVEIGKIGKIEIDITEVHEVEKNNRTGDDLTRQDAKELERLGLLKEVQKPVALLDEGKETEDKEDKSDEKEDGKEDEEPEKDAKSKKTDKADDASSSESKGEDLDPALKERIEQLIHDLKRQKAQPRVRAERHLKAIGAPAVPFLLPLLEEESELTRIGAARLLSEIGDETAIEPCIEALLDSNEHVREFANKTLEKVTHENFGFQAQASPRRREQARDKWRKWWDAEKAEYEKDQKLIQGGKKS